MSQPDPNFLGTFHRAACIEGLDYLLAGGFAASYWGEPRFTADVDYVTERTNLEVVKRTADHLGYRLAFLHPRGSFAHFVGREETSFRIDFIFVDRTTWQKLKEGASVVDFGGPELIPTVGFLHLVAMKLHAAKQPDRQNWSKDLNDIAAILFSQGLALEDLESSGILEKHGTERTIGELKRILGSRGGRS